MGLSASYYDAQRLELSTIHHTEEPIPIGTFIQFVFDNADFNVSTLDGRNTFHSMGGIKCITPTNTLHASTNVKRLNSAPPQEEVGQMGVLEVQIFEGRRTNALQQIIIEDLSFLKPIPYNIFTPTVQDLLWMSGKWLQEVEPTSKVPNIPECKGFMQLTSKLINKETTSVTFLPFINSPPNEYSTIRTALQYALKKSQEVGATACFVTFDQPLYLKAREISFGSIMVRLGGFHLLMSFLGCIGHTMAGSGLKDVLCQIFAANSVDKMLTGHAYSRAVRGHLLVQLVLAHIILDGANVSKEEKKDILTMMINMEEFTPDKVKENASLMSTLKKFQYHLETLKENGPTAALWVQYFNMVILMKKYNMCTTDNPILPCKLTFPIREMCPYLCARHDATEKQPSPNIQQYGTYKPVTTNDPVAPESILNTIFCRCTTGCGVRCGCRKARIACSSVCGVCSGSCTNGAPIENTVDDDVDDDILDSEDN
ncbi:unnamed protein product [Parnassius apollo]|uniref:(apollo) hypothetical protein n=1 Tax=Parnassius apollo TaxID=110799 RepID=A0A8S3WZI5_PARAO|nr:unnamed protein product [Parnassius apollo]